MNSIGEVLGSLLNIARNTEISLGTQLSLLFCYYKMLLHTINKEHTTDAICKLRIIYKFAFKLRAGS